MDDTAFSALYQTLIIDHGRQPRNCAVLAHANRIEQGHNPLCGDELTVYLIEQNGWVQSIRFQGSGCAISIASASLMTQLVQGKSIPEIEALFHDFHEHVMGKTQEAPTLPSKLKVLLGVKAYPSRIKCATLAWHTLMGALHQHSGLSS